jgi:hypothetical protein
MNAIPKINQKIGSFLPPPAGAAWRPLQHPKTLIGLSRQRLSLNDILKLIDARQIRWAWEISRRGNRRPEVRIWHESLLAYLAGESGGATPRADHLSLEQVIASILPKPAANSPRAATLHGRELQKRLLCGHMHISRLVADGELCCVGPLKKGKSRVILYQSAFEFLKRRSLSV